jgi:hypothetical protein
MVQMLQIESEKLQMKSIERTQLLLHPRTGRGLDSVCNNLTSQVVNNYLVFSIFVNQTISAKISFVSDKKMAAPDDDASVIRIHLERVSSIIFRIGSLSRQRAGDANARSRELRALQAEAESHLRPVASFFTGPYSKSKIAGVAMDHKLRLVFQRLRHDYELLRRQLDELGQVISLSSPTSEGSSAALTAVAASGVVPAAISVSSNPASPVDPDAVGRMFSTNVDDMQQLQSLREEEVLPAEDMQLIERDMRDLSALYTELSTYVQNQGDQLKTLETQTADADDNTYRATQELRSASKWSAAALPMVGACVGGLIAGPVGFVAGAKGFALGGAVLGGAGVGGLIGNGLRSLRTSVADRVRGSRPKQE